MLHKCHYCEKKDIDKTKTKFVYDNGSYFHEECYEIFKQRQFLYDTVKDVFKLKAPGPKIIHQAKTFFEKYGYTYYGMAMTVIYIFRVRKVKDKLGIDDKSIGLVPFYYEEAAAYYSKLEEKKQKLEEQALSAKNSGTKTSLTLTKRGKSLTYSLDDDQEENE